MSSDGKIIRGVELDVNAIQYSELKKRGNSPQAPKGVDMTIGGKPIVIQIPNARVPFGLNVFEDDKTGMKKYSLEISLGGSDAIDEFKEVLGELDDQNVNTIAENSKEWLGNKMKADTIKEAGNYGSLIRPDKKGENPPRFKAKLPVYNNKGSFVVFDKGSREPMEFVTMDDSGSYQTDWSWANNGMEVTLIAQCEGLWVINKNVYCTWKILQIKINKKSNKLVDYSFFDEDDIAEEEEIEEEDVVE